MLYEAEKRCLHVHATRGWLDQMPYEVMTGNRPDISEYLTFSFYKWVYFLDPTAFPEPEDQHVLGQWLGVAH